MILNGTNFEEEISKRSNERLSNIVFEYINRMHDAKLSCTLKDDELSKIIMTEGKIFANLVKQGKKTEEDVDSFEANVPNVNTFAYNHTNLDAAYSYIKEQNTDALMKRELRNVQSYSVENYHKGLRKIA